MIKKIHSGFNKEEKDAVLRQVFRQHACSILISATELLKVVNPLTDDDDNNIAEVVKAMGELIGLLAGSHTTTPISRGFFTCIHRLRYYIEVCKRMKPSAENLNPSIMVVVSEICAQLGASKLSDLTEFEFAKENAVP